MQRTFLILVGFGIALTHGRGLYVADAGTQPALFQTTRVSVASDGTQGNFQSWVPSISADGRYVSFHALASNLVPDDTNNDYDVFVHDRVTGTTTRVSVASGGTQGNGASSYASISADGRYVAFNSFATNLVPADTNNNADIFVYDRQTDTTTRVSVASGGTQGNGSSGYPSISADGRYVAFYGGASNLVPADTNGTEDVFIHDRDTGATTRVSVASNATQGNDWSSWPSISADGRYVAFYSRASNLVPADTNVRDDVFVHDRDTGFTTRVSVATGGTQGNGHSGSYGLAISPEGRYVAFETRAINLVPADTNGQSDVFVHDRQAYTTIRASVASGGTQGNNGSDLTMNRSISADGRYVAFNSIASNLVPGDGNGASDVFVHDRACLSITASPVTQTVCAGQPAAFSVTAEGDPPLTYQWRRNGIDIPEATGATYAIPSATPADAGSYDVVVTNGCGSLSSDPATLTVSELPGDIDCDGDVDLADYDSFADCLSGPGGGLPAPECACFDFDAGGEVDLRDFAEFQAQFTGP